MSSSAKAYDNRFIRFSPSTQRARSSVPVDPVVANLARAIGLDAEIDIFYDSGVTLLAPPNNRLERSGLDVDELLQTPEGTEAAADLVRAHMIRGNLYSEDLLAQEDQEVLVTTFLGTSMWITVTDGQVRFQGSDTLLPDQLSKNG